MLIKQYLSTPPIVVVLTALVFMALLMNREASTMEDLPVFLPDGENFIYVELSGGVLTSGIYQFYDGLTIEGVIKLTAPSLLKTLPRNSAWASPLRNGESIQIVKKDHKNDTMHRRWMKASHRVALAIPLHPDRMSTIDWTVLPGIGITLAERIENDRQKNGDFGGFEALLRVKGIGEKRINSWRVFF